MKSAQTPYINKSEGETTPISKTRLNYTEERVTELVNLIVEVGKESAQAPTPPIGAANVIVPVMSGGSLGFWTDLWTPTVRTAVFLRAVVPTDGTLADISFLADTTEEEGTCNVRTALYKPNAAENEFKLLSQSASQGVVSNGWESFAFTEPVLKAGETVYLAVMGDSVKPIKFWCQKVAAWGDTALPEGYLGAVSEPRLVFGWKFPTFEFKTFKGSESSESTAPDFGGSPEPSLAIVARLS